ncbi:MAG: hypothetical protein ACXWC8_23260, partial [Limisphaerales bacterium]
MAFMGRGIGIRGHMVFGRATAPVGNEARVVEGNFFSFPRFVERFCHVVGSFCQMAEPFYLMA